MSVLNPLKPSERMKIPRQLSLEQDAGVRNRNFEEVSHGLDEARAAIEATRAMGAEPHPTLLIGGKELAA